MKKFEPRLTRPEAGNKYYITQGAGGWSRAIKGKPTDPDCDVLHNCVGYAFGRFHEIAGDPSMSLFDPVNAENIYSNAQQHGLKVGKEPRLGSMIVWQKGATQSGSDGAGHVAIVERIERDGDTVTITTSESGYNCPQAFWTTARRAPYNNGAGYTFLGFVYQPDSVNPYPAPNRVLREGSQGTDVQWLQTELIRRGFLRTNECDGDYGLITLGAVCAFQLKNGLEVDGIAGPATQGALGK